MDLSEVITVTNPDKEVAHLNEFKDDGLDQYRVLKFNCGIDEQQKHTLAKQGFIKYEKDISSQVFYRRQLSLCIATMNRWDFLKNNIPRYLENPYIHEIIITDETGEDAEKLKSIDSPRIKVYVNEKRLYAFNNKHKAVSLATLPFVCLMDSDNFAPISYFNAWAAYLNGNEPDALTAYIPSFTIPQRNHSGFDYRRFANTVINMSNYKEIYKQNESLFNTGNYILSKQIHLPDELYHKLPINGALDVLCQNYIMLKNGGSLVVVPNMSYDHIVHEGSFYMASSRENTLGEEKIYKYFL